MNRQQHPTWEDELMPYLDGQLDAIQAAGIAEHLENCEDCAASVADTGRLSQQITEWTVEDSPDRLKDRVFAELRTVDAEKNHKERWLWWKKPQVWAVGLSGAFASLVLIFVISNRFDNQMHLTANGIAAPEGSPIATAVPPPAVRYEKTEQGQAQGQQPVQDVVAFQAEAKLPSAQTQSAAAEQVLGPMIIRTARLNIVARDFEGARSKLEAIVRQTKGYLDQITVKGESGSGKVLSATLRLPSDQFVSGLSDLRKIGIVKVESQNSSDVSSQYVDLRARLTNARNSESRLQTILKERTGKLSDVVDLEREISRVREDIERMEAQEKEISHQVQYASIQIEMSEEYHAQLVPSVPSAGTSLWNATVDGYHTAMDSLLGLALFVLRYGPALILWAALLLPIALFVRRFRRVGIF